MALTPSQIRGRWTLYEFARTLRVNGPHLPVVAGPDGIGYCEPVEVVPVPDEAAIERGAKALSECNWRSGSLTITDRMLVETVLRAALEAPEKP